MRIDQYLEELLSLADISEDYPIVSRDGQFVAWTWLRTGAVADVYMVRVDGSTAPVRLTNTPENTTLVSWTPDSGAVLVQQDKDGNERMQLFRVDIDNPGVMIPLTEPDPEYYLRGGQLHPNGRWLVYGANWDNDENKEIEATWVYRHDLISGERIPLAKPHKPAYSEPKLNSTGTHILYSRKDLHPAGMQIWMVDIAGLSDREILNFGAQVKTYANWFPDGVRVLVLTETSTHRKLGVWEMEQNELRWLLDDPDVDIEDAYVPYGAEQIVVLENRQGKTRSFLVDPNDGSQYRPVKVPGSLIGLAPTADGEWVGLYYHSQQPFDIIRTALDAEPVNEGQFMSLARVWERTNLKREDFSRAEEYSWESSDGLWIHGWLYRSEEPAKGTIVYVHGGPTWHSQDWINPQIQYLVRYGFNVLDPNYRGSTGYGIPFRQAILMQGWGGMEQEDIRTGIDSLIASGIAERGKVGITGTSYGGYSSWYAITHFPIGLVRAAAPICGMTDLVVDYETTRPDLRPYSEEMMGGSPAQVPERYRERSPINFVSDMQGKLLIVQGAQDPNVTPENVRKVIAALDEAGKSYELLVFEDEGHGIAKVENERTLFTRLATFFETAFTVNPA